MFYRTAGQFKTSYSADQALFPVRQDAVLLIVILAFAWIIFQLTASEFTFQTLLIPILIYSLAALGLNILTGYAGQLSLGTGAFMGVGAYACYKMVTLMPWMNPIVAILLSGVFSAGIGVVFGIPSLRIKGFYLAIATLAAQFFLVWLFEKWAWLYNYNASGAIQVPNLDVFGVYVAGPQATSFTQYYVVLAIVSLLTWVCINLTRGRPGRTWKATRDMDIAAELIGHVWWNSTTPATFSSMSRGRHCPSADQLIVKPPNGGFVAGDDAGGEDDQIAFAQGHVGMVVVGDPRQRGAGFSLAAGADDHRLVFGKVAGVLFFQEGGNVGQVTVFPRCIVDPH